MDNIYKYAAQHNLTFPSKRGELMVSQLFQLPLKARDGFDLDTVARTVNDQLKGVTQESFVEDTTADPRKTALAVMLDIVKDVIKTKQEENRAKLDKAKRQAEIQKIREIIDQKKDEKLSQASIEDLQKKLAELEA